MKVVFYLSGFLTIGVPTIKRINGMLYVIQTVGSIIDNTSIRDRATVVVVVFLADFDQEYNEKVVTELTAKYAYYIRMGFLHIVQLPKEFYPKLDGLKRNFGDRPERVKWRAKQVSDFSFMFLYSQNLSQYYIQIEDDVICAKNFVPAIQSYVKHHNSHAWAMLEFSELGFIGKLFKSSDLTKLAKYMLTFYDEQPVDWLIRYFRMSMSQKNIYLRKPTLFQHIGLKSSFDTSQDNKLKDRFFEGGSKLWTSDDPPGRVVTNIVTFDEWYPSLCYDSGSGYFWGKDPKPGDWLYIIFDEPQMLDKVTVETGEYKKGAKDWLANGTLEAAQTLVSYDEQKKSVICSSYTTLGHMEDGRLMAANLQTSTLRGIQTRCLKLTVGEGQKNWVIVQQIAVYLAKDTNQT